jgi:putative nucleotidyltransferase with HDIG domain
MNMRGNSGGSDRGANGALVLIFSPRERIRDIFSIGLKQSNYRVIVSGSSHLAMVKANQFLPDIFLIDITNDNTSDILMLSRLRRSTRTRSIPVITIVPQRIRLLIDRIRVEEGSPAATDSAGRLYVLEYPFNFIDLQKLIKEALSGIKEQVRPEAGEKPNVFDTERVATLLFDESIPVETKLGEIEKRLQKQWAFPFTVVKALDIRESDSGCSELARCIKSDVAASTAILKVANTVFYATRSAKRIVEIQDAVVRLGFRETRNLLSAMALIDLSPELYKNYGFSRHEFWLHSLATALIAEKLCADSGYRNPELAFLAGLMHDLGKIPADVYFQTVFMHLLEETADHIVAFHETEMTLLGFNHATLANFLVTRWNFPVEISQAILNHHDPAQILAAPRPVDRILQASVFVANTLAKALFIGHSCDEIIPDIPLMLLKDLHLTTGINDQFLPEVLRSLVIFCRYLNLPTADLLVARPRRDIASTRIVVVGDENVLFHPVSLALQSSGFEVVSVAKPSAENLMNVKVIVYLSTEGLQLDVVIYEDEQPPAEKSTYLRIYLLDTMPDQNAVKQMVDRNIIFLDRSHLDMRYLLHILDHFLQQVVVPDKQPVEL